MGDRVRRVRRWKAAGFGSGVQVYVTVDGATVLFRTRRGFVYETVYVPFVSDDGADQKQQIAECVWEVHHVKKKDRTKTAGAGLHASPDLLAGHYPQLAEWLTSAVYEDGEKREGPTLTLWASGGQWRLTLKDRSEGLVMWLSSERLLELLMLADQYCQEEEGPWRVDDFSADRGKRKKGLS